MTVAQLHTPEECRARLNELRADFIELPSAERTDEQNQRVATIISEVNSLDERITTLEVFERRSRATGLAGTGRHGPGNGALEFRSGGRMFVESDAFKEWERRGFSLPPASAGHASPPGMIVELECRIDQFSDVLETRAPIGEFGASGPGFGFGTPTFDSSNAGMLMAVGQPIAPIPRVAKLYMRDLLPVTGTTLSNIPYVQELNPVANEAGATSVAEGSVKPNATLAFQGAKADPTVIATTLVMSKQLFQDAPAVIQYLNNRLPYLVKFREDWELLNGAGNWPEMQGILNVPGIQSQPFVNTDIAQTLGSAFALVENADGAPTAVVMNPNDAWAMFTKRAAAGGGTFDAGTPFSALPMTVWGVPTYRTRAKAAGTALVGDFQRGGQIFDRQQVGLQIYNERYAELNQTLLLCEERIGAAWYRPDLFVNATI